MSTYGAYKNRCWVRGDLGALLLVHHRTHDSRLEVQSVSKPTKGCSWLLERFRIARLDLEYHDLLSLFEFLDNGDGEITLTERQGCKNRARWQRDTVSRIDVNEWMLMSFACAAEIHKCLVGLSLPTNRPHAGVFGWRCKTQRGSKGFGHLAHGNQD